MRALVTTAAFAVLTAGCGGRMQADAHPVAPPAPEIAQAPLPAPTAAPRDTATTAVAPGLGDTATSARLPISRDSAADNAALDSLAVTKLPDALPDVVAPTWDINVADFTSQPRVQYYLDYFSGKAHDRFQIWLTRMPRYEGYIRGRLADHGLPGDLVYLSLIESGFAPDAVSRANAVGMWQFIAETGRLFGLRIDGWVDERRDPIKATDAATRDLEELTDEFGSHYLAAAAYNAGAGKVERGLGLMGSTSGADETFFSLADTRWLRDETKNYVPQLIAAALIAKEPARYGFDVPTDVAPFPRDSVMVDGGTGLDLMARLAGTTFETMRDLNPELLRGVTPPGIAYPIRVPAGMADGIAAAYSALPESGRKALLPHRVVAGETVALLAARYNIAADAIRSANRVVRHSPRLVPGTMLYLPLTTGIPGWMLRESDPPRGTVAASRTVISRSGGGATYAVESGETLSGIAEANGTTVAAILSANHMSSGDVLKAGQQLVIPGARAVSAGPHGAAAIVSPPASSMAASPVPPAHTGRRVIVGTTGTTHVVKAGETVGGIATDYGIAQSALVALNHLGKAAKITIGQILKIPPR